MPVRKQSATKLRRAGETYVTLPSATIKMIKNPVSLAILAYLLDQAEDWEVWRDHLMTRFGIGRDRYDKAMKHLRQLGLCWTVITRNAGGQIEKRQICVSAVPMAPEDQDAENQQLGEDLNAGNPQLGETTRQDSPQCGDSGHLTMYKQVTKDQQLPYSDPCGSAAGAANSVDNSFQALGVDYQSPTAEQLIFNRGAQFLGQYGIQEPDARQFLGMLNADHGSGRTLDAVVVAIISQPAGDPKAFLLGVVANQPRPMDTAWEPEAGLVGELEGLGIPVNMIRDARDIFVTWFKDMEIMHSDWPRLFKAWVVRDWEHAEMQLGQYRQRLAQSAGLNYQPPWKEPA